MDVASILNGQWDFRIEHKGIKIFSSCISGSDIQGFKGEVELRVSLKKLISIFHDMQNYTRWVHHLTTMEILEKVDAVEYMVRQVIEVPWPLQQREVIMRTRLVAAGDNAIALTMQEEPDYLPLNPHYHRVLHSRGTWVFTPEGDELIRVIFAMHLDPGKEVPAALSNTGMFEVPFYTMNNLRTLLQDQTYNPAWPKELEDHLAIIEDDLSPL